MTPENIQTSSITIKDKAVLCVKINKMLVFSVLLIVQAMLACGEILNYNWKQIVHSFAMSTDTFSGDQNYKSYGQYKLFIMRA